MSKSEWEDHLQITKTLPCLRRYMRNTKQLKSNGIRELKQHDSERSNKNIIKNNFKKYY